MDNAVTDLWYAVYLVFAVAVFWSWWRLVRLTDLSTGYRRALFVLFGTALFTPGLVLLIADHLGFSPLGAYYLWLLTDDIGETIGHHTGASVLITRIGITASLFFLAIAAIFVKRPAQRAKWNWTYAAFPPSIIVAAVLLIAAMIPDYQVPQRITEDRLEEMYGMSLDAVEALDGIVDPAVRSLETGRLRDLFKSDPTVFEVSLRAGSNGDVRRVFFRREQSLRLSSCWWPWRAAGRGRWEEGWRPLRCVPQTGNLDDRETLRYIRADGVGASVVVLFDYGQLLEKM